MEKLPTVTIVMPAYNVELYIEKSIKSVIDQSDDDWELIIVNDGSTDATRCIIEKYSKLDDRIRVIHQENKGVSYARNIGIKLARGIYISFLDADDQYCSDYIIKMKRVLIMENAQVAFCKFREYQDDIILKETPHYIKSLYKNNFVLHIMSHLHSKINMGFMYKLSWLKKNGVLFNVELTHSEDSIFVLLATYGANVIFVPHYLYFYIYREDSVSRSKVTVDRLFQKIETYRYYWSYFKRKETSEGDEYALYLEYELITLYENLKRKLWKALQYGNYRIVLGFIENLTIQKKRLDYNFFHKRNLIKRFFNDLKWKIILSKNIVIWRSVTFLSFKKKKKEKKKFDSRVF